MENRTTALVTYLPKWNGFHVNELGEKMTATDALVGLYKVVSCLTNVWVKESDLSPVKRKPADFNIQKVSLSFMYNDLTKSTINCKITLCTDLYLLIRAKYPQRTYGDLKMERQSVS